MTAMFYSHFFGLVITLTIVDVVILVYIKNKNLQLEKKKIDDRVVATSVVKELKFRGENRFFYISIAINRKSDFRTKIFQFFNLKTLKC